MMRIAKVPEENGDNDRIAGRMKMCSESSENDDVRSHGSRD